ncbi:hypothetical protein LX36DRAFT_654221 [Colletotrichum falcatum]|nr:hypothetical protein LX36DRAFT_654221 [Colletotrichum falcatum]
MRRPASVLSVQACSLLDRTLPFAAGIFVCTTASCFDGFPLHGVGGRPITYARCETDSQWQVRVSTMAESNNSPGMSTGLIASPCISMVSGESRLQHEAYYASPIPAT